MKRNRVESILEFDLALHSDGSTFFNGLVACLTPEEKCRALRGGIFAPYAKRAVLVRRLVNDMQQTVLPCHISLANELNAFLATLSGKERVTCAMVLLEVAENIPGPNLEFLLDELLASSNGNIRKQVYRRIKARAEMGCPGTVVGAWLRFGDFEACRLLVDRASTVVLSKWFNQVEDSVASEGWLLARLYLRFMGRAPATLRRLERMDVITYAYVAAKLGRKVSAAKLVAFYKDRMLDQRAGLLVWSAGQMGLWNAIERMKNMRQKPSEHVIREHYGSIGLSLPVDQLPVP